MSRFPEHLSDIPPLDPLYEAFVKAWSCYHVAAYNVDGHIKHPCTREDWEMVHRAVKAGNHAMNDSLNESSLSKPSPYDNLQEYRMWQNAKLTALRRLGRA